MIPTLDVYVDRSGERKIFSENLKISDKITEFICFDVRNMLQLGYPVGHVIYDVKMLHEHDGSFSSLVKRSKIHVKETYLEVERRFAAHTRAISESKVDIDSVPLSKLIPRDLLNEYMDRRVLAIAQLFNEIPASQVQKYRESTWPVMLDILKIEDSGICIDVPFVESMLKRNDLASHEMSFFRSTKGLAKDGFVKTKVSPVGSKTARFRSEGGFHAQGVPHGVCRKSLVSRFEGGSILSLDFNAIDYRSLISVVNDPKLNKLYMGARDFHAVTASQLNDPDPDIRDLAKKVTYTRIYGGSVEGLQKQTKLPLARLLDVLQKLDKLFEPITVFREKLAEQARLDGYLYTPGGHRIDVANDDHDGKIVGLYAQTYSSVMFNRAIRVALDIIETRLIAGSPVKSKMIFTVHDEIDIDLHPKEQDLVSMLQYAIEKETGFVIKAKQGRTYSDATD